MAKELPFFKFDIMQWMLGRIQKMPLDVQGTFINLCCKYWHKLGELSFTDACLDFDKSHIMLLNEKSIIGIDSDYLYIKFLDEQLDECAELSKKNSIKGLKSAKVRALRKQPPATTIEPESTVVEPQLKVVQPDLTEEKRREEKRREEKREDSVLTFGSYYQSAANAFELIKQDELLIEQYQLSLSGKGIRIDKIALVASIRSFLIDQSVDKEYFVKNDSNEVRRHLGNWLRKKTGEDFEQYKKAL